MLTQQIQFEAYIDLWNWTFCFIAMFRMFVAIRHNSIKESLKALLLLASFVALQYFYVDLIVSLS